MRIVAGLEARYPDLVEIAEEYRTWRFHSTLLWIYENDGLYGDQFGKRIGAEANAAEAEARIRGFLARQAEPAERVDAYLSRMRKVSRENAIAYRARTTARGRLIEQWHLVRRMTAKDHTGRTAYYVVLLRPDRVAAFDARLGQPLDLDDYGQVIGSCYGDPPTPELRQQLVQKHGFYEWEL